MLGFFADLMKFTALNENLSINNLMFCKENNSTISVYYQQNENLHKKNHQWYDQLKNSKPNTNEQNCWRTSKWICQVLIGKIEWIRSKLTAIKPCTPKEYDTLALWRFTTLTEDQLYKVIMDMPTKACELDIIPIRLLKQVLHSCIPAITKIINLSLDNRDFSAQWK